MVGLATALTIAPGASGLGRPDEVTVSPTAPVDICSSHPARPATVVFLPAQPDVAVVGDSQTVGEWCAGADGLRARFRYEEVGLTAMVKGVAGARSDQVLRLLTSAYPRRSTLPHSIVFTAGGNDAAARRSPARFAAVLRRLLAYVPASSQVYLTTLSYNPNGADADLRARRAAYNDVMRLVAARHRNVHIIDFDLVVRRDHLVFIDDVHLEGAAYNVRAWIEAHAVATCQSATVCPEPG